MFPFGLFSRIASRVNLSRENVTGKFFSGVKRLAEKRKSDFF